MKEKKVKTFAEKAYKHTKLDSEYTWSKIEDMLSELGISNMRVTRNGEDYSVEFLVNLYRGEAPRKVRINVPVDSEGTESQRRNIKNAIFRVLYYNLKNRFVTVTNGLKEFEEEFAMDLVVNVNGGEYRLGDIIIPEIRKQVSDGGMLMISKKTV